MLCSVLAAKNLSDAAYSNFLDHTFLADRKTTIREYLATTGSGIMEEEPPEALRARYGGWLTWYWPALEIWYGIWYLTNFLLLLEVMFRIDLFGH